MTVTLPKASSDLQALSDRTVAARDAAVAARDAALTERPLVVAAGNTQVARVAAEGTTQVGLAAAQVGLATTARTLAQAARDAAIAQSAEAGAAAGVAQGARDAAIGAAAAALATVAYDVDVPTKAALQGIAPEQGLIALVRVDESRAGERNVEYHTPGGVWTYLRSGLLDATARGTTLAELVAGKLKREQSRLGDNRGGTVMVSTLASLKALTAAEAPAGALVVDQSGGTYEILASASSGADDGYVVALDDGRRAVRLNEGTIRLSAFRPTAAQRNGSADSADLLQRAVNRAIRNDLALHLDVPGTYRIDRPIELVKRNAVNPKVFDQVTLSIYGCGGSAYLGGGSGVTIRAHFVDLPILWTHRSRRLRIDNIGLTFNRQVPVPSTPLPESFFDDSWWDGKVGADRRNSPEACIAIDPFPLVANSIVAAQRYVGTDSLGHNYNDYYTSGLNYASASVRVNEVVMRNACVGVVVSPCANTQLADDTIVSDCVFEFVKYAMSTGSDQNRGNRLVRPYATYCATVVTGRAHGNGIAQAAHLEGGTLAGAINRIFDTDTNYGSGQSNGKGLFGESVVSLGIVRAGFPWVLRDAIVHFSTVSQSGGARPPHIDFRGGDNYRGGGILVDGCALTNYGGSDVMFGRADGVTFRNCLLPGVPLLTFAGGAPPPRFVDCANFLPESTGAYSVWRNLTTFPRYGRSPALVGTRVREPRVTWEATSDPHGSPFRAVLTQNAPRTGSQIVVAGATVLGVDGASEDGQPAARFALVGDIVGTDIGSGFGEFVGAVTAVDRVAGTITISAATGVSMSRDANLLSGGRLRFLRVRPGLARFLVEVEALDADTFYVNRRAGQNMFFDTVAAGNHTSLGGVQQRVDANRLLLRRHPGQALPAAGSLLVLETTVWRPVFDPVPYSASITAGQQLGVLGQSVAGDYIVKPGEVVPYLVPQLDLPGQGQMLTGEICTAAGVAHHGTTAWRATWKRLASGYAASP